jgi:PAS domain S-box-containing protein
MSVPTLNAICGALLLLTAVASGALAAFGWRRRAAATGAAAFAAAMLAVGWWSLFYAAELLSTDPQTQRFWNSVEYPGIVAVPVAWFVFACLYTGRQALVRPGRVAALCIVPAATVAIVWTDPWHHLMYERIAFSTAPLALWASSPGPWYWAHIIYSYALVLAGSVYFALLALNLAAAHRGQSTAVLLGVAAPWIASAVYVTKHGPVPGLDLTPFGFALTGGAAAWGLIRHRLLDVVPIAYRAVLDGLPDAVVVLDASDTIVDANLPARRVLGGEDRSPIGRPLRQVLQAWTDLADALREPAAATQLQATVSGVTRDYELEVSELAPRGGARTGRALVLRDITARKGVERALARSERLYRDAIEAAAGVPYKRLWSASGFDYIGDGIEGLLGLPTGQVDAQSLRALIVEPAPPPGGATVDPASGGAAAGWADQPILRVDYHVRTPSGESRWVTDSFALVHDETTGAPIGALGILQDITHRKLAEDALREALARFESVVENAPVVAIQGMDREGVVLHWNRASAALYGYEAHEVIGRKLQSVVLGEEAGQHLEELLARGWETGEAPPPMEWQVVTRDGRARWVYSSMFPVMQHGAVAEIFCMDVDVTDRRRLEETQRLAAVGHLAAGVAHEFNNLLAALMMRAELTALEPDADGCAALTELALRAAQRGSETCRDLIAFARPREPRRTAMEIEAAIDAALAVAATQLQAAQIDVRRDYGTGGHRIMGDSGQLEQAFLNLIINACHAMSARGAPERAAVLGIRTRAIRDDDGATRVGVWVSDTGVGILPADLPHVFEPFFTTKGPLGAGSATPGSGLGLSVAHGAVAAHGGSIGVRSEPGAGTTFELSFAADAAAGSQQGASAGPPPPAPPRRPGRCVLLAEDEDDLREVISEALSRHGCQVIVAGSAAPAVEALRSRDIDLVITDMLMPEGGGRAVLAAVAELAARPPVLVITGRADDGLEAELAGLQATRCLRKPFGITDVLTTVDELLP